MKNKRLIAMYLPQYHPIKENDEWWGKGFTEWTNVTKAKPLFKKHYQPHLPTDLGFYDLRIPEIREAQAKLASEYGIYGFCYYHYWFSGKQLLERPIVDVLKSGKPDFPFMLCWANETWARGWDGSENKILIKQEYSEEDDYNHINYLLSFFEDPRYIRVNGKPVLMIYHSTKIPDLHKTISIWRSEALKHGLELYICRFESFGESGKNYLADVFDASAEFQPHPVKYCGFNANEILLKRIFNKISRFLFARNLIKNIESYPKYVSYVMKQLTPSYKCYPCVVPMWDNTARRGRNFFAFTDSTPQLFKKWLIYSLQSENYSEEENFVFINAWNEWAEGNHLEPCIKWRHSYLEAVKESIEEYDK